MNGTLMTFRVCRLTCEKQRVVQESRQRFRGIATADGNVAISTCGEFIRLPIVGVERFQHSFERSL